MRHHNIWCVCVCVCVCVRVLCLERYAGLLSSIPLQTEHTHAHTHTHQMLCCRINTQTF